MFIATSMNTDHVWSMIIDIAMNTNHVWSMIIDIAMNIDRQWSLIMSIITHDQWSLPWDAVDHTWSVLINGLYRDPYFSEEYSRSDIRFTVSPVRWEESGKNSPSSIQGDTKSLMSFLFSENLFSIIQHIWL